MVAVSHTAGWESSIRLALNVTFFWDQVTWRLSLLPFYLLKAQVNIRGSTLQPPWYNGRNLLIALELPLIGENTTFFKRDLITC